MPKAKEKTDQPFLNVQRRELTGTRPMRRLRRSGQIPGIIYGRETKPVAVTIPAKPLVQLLRSKAGEHALVRLRIENAKGWEKPALVHEVQYDAVDGDILHVDFHVIVLTEQIKVKVPVILKGEAVGVKQDGGILEHFLREIEVECLPTEIPEQLEFEVSALKIGDTVHVRQLPIPKTVKLVTDPEAPLASVLAPKEEKEEEAPAEETAEPEVIREKKAEGEAATGEEGEAGKEKAKEAGEKKEPEKKKAPEKGKDK